MKNFRSDGWARRRRAARLKRENPEYGGSDIIDKDRLLLSEKMARLTAKQVRIVESVIDECIALFGDGR